MLLDYGANTNETPPGADTPAYGHAVSTIGANWSLELHLNHAALTSAGDDSHGCSCADIEHQRLAGVNGLYIGFVRNSHDPFQQLHIHGKSASCGRKFAGFACDLAHQCIAFGHDGIEQGAYAHQAAGSDLILNVTSGQESYHFGLDGNPLFPAFIFHQPAGADLYLVAHMQHSLAEGAAYNSALEGFRSRAWPIDVEGASNL